MRRQDMSSDPRPTMRDLDSVDPEWRKWFTEKQAREYYRRRLKSGNDSAFAIGMAFGLILGLLLGVFFGVLIATVST